MTAKKKTKKQTPQAVLDLIARQADDLEFERGLHKQFHQAWIDRGVLLCAAEGKLEKALADNENYKKQCFDRAKQVEVLEKALTDAEFRCDRDRDAYANNMKTLEAKLRETEAQVGKFLADAKRARDEQSRVRVYVLTYQPISGGAAHSSVFETEEDAKKSVNLSHGKNLKWVAAARAQLYSTYEFTSVVGEYVISERRVQKTQP